MPETSPPPYRKLPGRSFGFFRVSRLWLGEDHLLQVTSTFGIDDYRRFYLRDVEAFIIQRTGRRLVWNGVLGALGGCIALVCALIWSGGVAPDGPGRAFALGCLLILGALAAIFFGLMLLNTWRGPSCEVFIQNAAGLERLLAPRRVPAARRALERARPWIEAAQAQPESLPPAAAPAEEIPAAISS